MRYIWASQFVAAFLVVSAPSPGAAQDEPRKHKRYQPLVAAFSAAIAEHRPLEESCKVLNGQTGIAALDHILKPYFDRQLTIPHGAARFPIVDCRYTATQQGRDGRVIMMNPSPDQLAIWIITACTKRGIRRADLTEDACMVKAARMIWHQTNAQYPITGYIPEPASECEGSPPGTDTAMFGFRDGVTAALAGTPHEDNNEPKNPCGKGASVAATCTTAMISSDQINDALSATVTKLPLPAYARLSNLPMKEVLSATPTNRCPAKNGEPPEWLSLSRNSFLSALGTNSYSFLEKWVGTKGDDERFTCKAIEEPNLLADCGHSWSPRSRTR